MIYTWADLDEANKRDGHYTRRNTSTDMVKYYYAKGMSEEAYRLRDEAQERMESEGYLDRPTLRKMEEVAERWLQRAYYHYALANECSCKPDAVEVCASCKAHQEAKYGNAIPFEA
jgi:hypothetical protein